MVDCDAEASALVVWEGSHEMVRSAMQSRFSGIAPELWGNEDITEAYHSVRQQIFEECRRVSIPAKPGETYLLHRLALHGISPWQDGARAGEDGRMICYFRPDFGNAGEWLNNA